MGRKSWRPYFTFTAASLAAGLFCTGQLAAQPAAGAVDYARQVHSVLAAKCLVCHSQVKRSGGLSLAAYETCSMAAAAVPR